MKTKTYLIKESFFRIILIFTILSFFFNEQPRASPEVSNGLYYLFPTQGSGN